MIEESFFNGENISTLFLSLLGLSYSYLFFSIFFLIQLILIFILTFAVKRDADRRVQARKGLFLVSPLVWCLIVFFSGGYSGVFAYWLVHYSILKASDSHVLDPFLSPDNKSGRNSS